MIGYLLVPFVPAPSILRILSYFGSCAKVVGELETRGDFFIFIFISFLTQTTPICACLLPVPAVHLFVRLVRRYVLMSINTTD